jgi:stalled ribosome rescue protein Dom34
MKKLYGIWIDHNKAFVFKANEEGILSMENFVSEVEAHHHSGINNSEHSTLSDQSQHDKRRANEMLRFVKQIVTKVHDADEILIFGPSTAKKVLQDSIKENKSMSRVIVTVTVADKLTENQMRESVRDFFALPKNK